MYYRQAEVERGIALLDARKPGWRKAFNPETLRMGSPWHCVLGQAFGSYLTGLRLLGVSDYQAAEYGFEPSPTLYGLELTEQLGKTWIELTKQPVSVPV